MHTPYQTTAGRPSARRALRAVAALGTAAALVAAGAVGAQASTKAPKVETVHVAITAVSGALPAGAGITVVQSCPRGTDLDRSFAGVEAHAGVLRRTSRELWPAGVATRYTVRSTMGADDVALVATAAVCVHRTRHGAHVVRGLASVDTRVWGPAPADVDLASVAVVAGVDLANGRMLRTSVRAAGVGSSRGSLKAAVAGVQEALTDDADVQGVAAAGVTTRSVPRGRFASLLSSYRFRVAV